MGLSEMKIYTILFSAVLPVCQLFCQPLAKRVRAPLVLNLGAGAVGLVIVIEKNEQART
jgi:hypothetical protein